jgi:hypothetical protein
MALPDLNRRLIRTTTVPVVPGLKLNIYAYATEATAATVLTAGHFNFARAYLRPGDRIKAYTEIDDAVDSVDLPLKVLTVPAAGNVTVADMTPVAEET